MQIANIKLNTTQIFGGNYIFPFFFEDTDF